MQWRTLVLSLLFPLLPACGSQPRSVPPQVSSAGFTALTSWKFGGWIYLENETYVPGAIAVSKKPVITKCRSVSHDIRVEHYGASISDIESTCLDVSSAAREAEHWFPGRSARYSIIVVPEGHSIYVKRRSLVINSIHVTLATADFSVRNRYDGNLVDLVAHESYHALGILANDQRGGDEYTAYYAGLCAQLEVIGSIPESALPGAPLTDGADEATRNSSETAYLVRREVFPLLHDGSITSDSDGGRILAKRCQELRSGIHNSDD